MDRFFLNIIGVTVVMFLLSSCMNGQVKDELVKSSAKSDSSEIFLGYEDFKLVGSLKKEYSSNSTTIELDSLGCDKWMLKKDDLKGILVNMVKADPVEWNAYCYTYPCSYKGSAANKGVKYDLYINAASYISLTNGKEKLYFIAGYKISQFLISCDCCEDE